jgi:hypothetical protein
MKIVMNYAVYLTPENRKPLIDNLAAAFLNAPGLRGSRIAQTLHLTSLSLLLESLGAPVPVLAPSQEADAAPLAAPGEEASAEQHFRITNIRIELEEERVRRKELEKSLANLERE